VGSNEAARSAFQVPIPARQIVECLAIYRSLSRIPGWPIQRVFR
jgi:hypothetical protein